MNMGWFITIIGIVLMVIGTILTKFNKNLSKNIIILIGIIVGAISLFFTIYGQSIKEIKKNHSITNYQNQILNPQEEKLLSLIYKYQKESGLNKLIISRDGFVYFEGKDKDEQKRINLIGELYNINSDFKTRSKEFESIILNISEKFLKLIPESRLDSPYVVTITEEGIRYIKNNFYK